MTNNTTAETLTITFKKNVDGSEANILQLIQSKDKQTTVTAKLQGSSEWYNVSLSKADFHKAINEPSKFAIEITFQLNPTKIKDLVKNLSLSYLDVTFTQENSGKKKEENIAQNFMVYSIMRSDEESDVRLNITAYSPDKLLDMDEYCKAYTAKKLVNEIVLNEGKSVSQTFSSKEEENKDENKDEKKPPFGKNIGQCKRIVTANETYLKVVTGKDAKGNDTEKMSAGLKIATNLNILKYSNSKENKREFIHPYLVQYNETFYRFLVRTMNRFGEFVYYEDDTLYLGLYDATSAQTLETKQSENSSGSIVVDSAEWNNCCLENDSTEVEEYDYTGYFPEDDENYYHSELLEQANLAQVTQTNVVKDSAKSWESYKKSKFWIGFLTKIANVLPSKVEVGKNIMMVICKEFSSITSAISVANEYKEEVIDTALPESRNGDGDNATVYPYTSNPDNFSKDYSCKLFGEKKLLDINLYNNIYQQEILAEKGMITFTLTNQTVLFKLGGLVYYDENDYVVIGFDYDYIGGKGKVCALPKSTTYEMFFPCPIKERIRKAAPQSAVVIDNADRQGYGRVRVRFAWDTESSTPFIRMVRPFASSNKSGTMFVPIKDDEVLVNFTNGNVEMPYVEGMLYSKTNKSSTISDAETLTIKSRNGHKIEFSDPEGDLPFLTTFSPFIDLLTSMFSGVEDKLKFNSEKNSSGGISMSDANGLYEISMSATDRNISIKSSVGDIDINALTGITINAPAGDVRIKGKNISLEASNNISIVSGKKIKPWGGGKLSLTDLSKELALACTDAIASAVLEKVAVIDLSVVRTIFEMFIPPSEGTLLLKSARHLALEAGKGNTHIGVTRKTNKDGIVSVPGLDKLNEHIMAWENFIDEYTKFIHTEIEKLKEGTSLYKDYVKAVNKFIKTLSGNNIPKPAMFHAGYKNFNDFYNATGKVIPDESDYKDNVKYKEVIEIFNKLNDIKLYRASTIYDMNDIKDLVTDNIISQFSLIPKNENCSSVYIPDEDYYGIPGYVPIYMAKEENQAHRNITKAARASIGKNVDVFFSNDTQTVPTISKDITYTERSMLEEKKYWRDVVKKYKDKLINDVKDHEMSAGQHIIMSYLATFLGTDADENTINSIRELRSWRNYEKQPGESLIRISDSEHKVWTFDNKHNPKECGISDVTEPISTMDDMLEY